MTGAIVALTLALVAAVAAAAATHVGKVPANSLLAGATTTTTAVDSCGYGPATSTQTTAPDPFHPGSTVLFDENTVTRGVGVFGSGSTMHVGAFADDETGLLLGVNGASPWTGAGATTLNQTLSQNIQYGTTAAGYGLQVAATPVAYSAGDSIVLKNAGGSQSLTLKTAAAAGSTTITVNTFKAARNYAVGDSVNDSSITYGQKTTGLSLGANVLDAKNRPEYPAVYLTDLTLATKNGTPFNAGDWEQSASNMPANLNAGTPFASGVFGTWATATGSAGSLTITTPKTAGAAANNSPLNLGPNADTPPTGTTFGESYATEVQWTTSSLGMIAGHGYRIQVITHDGDQNKTSGGGDTGEFCTNIPPVPTTESLVDTTTNPPTIIPGTTSSTDSTTYKAPGGSNIVDTVSIPAIAGAGNATGTVDFHLYSDSSCQNEVFHSNGVALTNANPAVATSGPFQLSSAAGTKYYWQDVYHSSNPNYEDNSEACGAETVTVVNAQITLNPEDANNVVGNPHTFTAQLQTNDGSGGAACQVANPAPLSCYSNATDGNGLTGSPSITMSIVSDTTGDAHFTTIGSNPPDNLGTSDHSCLANNGKCSLAIVSGKVGTVTLRASSTFTATAEGVVPSFTVATTPGGSNTTCQKDHTTNTGTCDAVKVYFNPSTTLHVTDTLTGLPPDADGSVTYDAYTSLSACNAGTSNGDAAHAVVTGFTVSTDGKTSSADTSDTSPNTNGSADVPSGTTIYWRAHWVSADGKQTFTSTCSDETASSK